MASNGFRCRLLFATQGPSSFFAGYPELLYGTRPEESIHAPRACPKHSMQCAKADTLTSDFENGLIMFILYKCNAEDL